MTSRDARRQVEALKRAWPSLQNLWQLAVGFGLSAAFFGPILLYLAMR